VSSNDHRVFLIFQGLMARICENSPIKRLTRAHSLILSAVFVVSTAHAANGISLSAVGIHLPYEAPAHVISRSRSDIAVQIDGPVKSVNVFEGQTVRKGDVLFTIDCRSYVYALKLKEVALTLAQNKAELAKASLQRSRARLRISTISKAKFESDQLNYQTSLLNVRTEKLYRDSAQLAVDRCKVSAPFSGVVTRIATGQGSYLTTGTVVMSMSETEHLEVIANLTSDEINSLIHSSRIDFVFGKTRFPLKLKVVEPVINQATGAQRVYFDLPPKAALPINLAGTLRWKGERFRIPPDYLIHGTNGLGVLIDRGGKSVFFPVPAAIDGMPVIIHLPATTKIIKP